MNHNCLITKYGYEKKIALVKHFDITFILRGHFSEEHKQRKRDYVYIYINLLGLDGSGGGVGGGFL